MPDMTRALRAAVAEPWAITAEGLELVLTVAGRENEVSVEALEAYRAKHVPTAERLQQRGPVAIIEARGPMFRHANLFTALSGATSYDMMRRDLQVALDDPNTRAVVMSFDTPGGVVTGVNELAEAIRAGAEKKPIVAYVGGAAASAGYWLASQATEIVIDATAMLGSIGVRAVVSDTSAKDAAAGRIEFISSQSPGKRTDLATDEGRGRIQRQVDALADVFIATVASGRGVKPEDVVARFGGGDVLVGVAAVAAGMADRIGSFEAVVAELAGGRSLTPQPTRKFTMNENTIPRAEHDAAVATARTEGKAEGKAEGMTAGAAAERARIQAILALAEAKGREASALHMAMTTEMTADAVKGVLAGLPVAAAPAAPEARTEDQRETPERSQDAVGGLVTVTPPRQERTGDKSKALWGKTIEALNANSPKRAAH